MRVYTIGRDRTCDYQIDDCIVGVFHLQIVVRDDRRISVVDFGSHIGTSLNGRRVVGEMMLRPRDELRIGDIVVPWQRIVGLSAGSVAGKYKPVAKPQLKTATWVWVVIGCLSFLALGFAAGMVWFYMENNDKTAVIETQRGEIAELQRELDLNKNAVQELRSKSLELEEQRLSLDTLVDFYHGKYIDLKEELRATQVELEAGKKRVPLNFDVNYRY